MPWLSFAKRDPFHEQSSPIDSDVATADQVVLKEVIEEGRVRIKELELIIADNLVLPSVAVRAMSYQLLRLNQHKPHAD